METYQNVNGNSGIAGYKIGDTCIEVEFADTESVYRYSYESAGRECGGNEVSGYAGAWTQFVY